MEEADVAEQSWCLTAIFSPPLKEIGRPSGSSVPETSAVPLRRRTVEPDGSQSTSHRSSDSRLRVNWRLVT